MPSGDTAAAALFCYLYAQIVQLEAIYILLPLVVLGRVYYQCHWFGDTLIGAVVGTFWGQFTCTHFGMILPLVNLIANANDLFIPVK